MKTAVAPNWLLVVVNDSVQDALGLGFHSDIMMILSVTCYMPWKD